MDEHDTRQDKTIQRKTRESIASDGTVQCQTIECVHYARDERE